MHTQFNVATQRSPSRIALWLGFSLFALILLFFLWEEHRAEMLAGLPYALLLLCPIIHLFMHGRHRAERHDASSHKGHAGHGDD